jgi:hypothetical protein
VRFLNIVLFATVASIVYGVLHDQITVRLCVEYFTIGHPTAIDTEDPTTLALLWGVIATWWVGAGLGLLLATAARLGKRPKLRVVHLVLPVLWTILVSAATGVLAGLVGHFGAKSGWWQIAAGLAELVPEEEHVAYVTNLWVHNGSYAGGALMGLAMVIQTWRRRGALRRRARALGSSPRKR